MLTDLLKALELLMDALKGIKTSEKRREKVARQLFLIYLDIDQILDQGKNILALLRSDSPWVQESVALNMLIAQQKALDSLASHISAPIINGVLKLHLSEFKELNILYQAGGKADRLKFYLSQLTASSPEEHGWSKIAVGKLMPHSDIFVVIQASQEQIREAKNTLAKIARLHRNLRVFLTEKFQFEDVL
jgi:hypothetical protein